MCLAIHRRQASADIWWWSLNALLTGMPNTQAASDYCQKLQQDANTGTEDERISVH